MGSDILSQLITLSRNLGDPALDYAILGEGNTSARADGDTFWVKASGAELRTIDANGFVRVHFDHVLALLETDDLSDDDVKASLEAAKVDPTAAAHPSVETVLHALALQADGVNFVGHTHPTAVNAVLCSQKAEEAVAGRLFPDEIVYCGPAPVYVPYTDPGLPLARAVRQARQAGIIEREAPIDVSNVMLLCGKCNHPARIGHRFLEDGKKVRFCRRQLDEGFGGRLRRRCRGWARGRLGRGLWRVCRCRRWRRRRRRRR